MLSKYIERESLAKIDDMVTLVLIQDQKDWKFVSDLIPGSTADRCMFKWLSLKKFNLAKYKWEETESKILSDLVK